MHILVQSIYSCILSVVVEDLLSFYILFEVMLVVMVLSITSYWYSTRSTYAVYMLIVYTLLGSSAMALALSLQYVATGVSSSTHGVERYPHCETLHSTHPHERSPTLSGS